MYFGGKCAGGTVLIGDRKIKDEETNDVTYEGKIFSPYYPFVIGYSGSKSLFNKFKERALEAVQPTIPINSKTPTYLQSPLENLPEVRTSGEVRAYFSSPSNGVLYSDYSVNLNRYVLKLEEIIKQLKRDYSHLNIDVLFGTRTIDRGDVLYYIDNTGTSEDVPDFQPIGAEDVLANALLKPLWRQEMTLEKLAELGYFIIKYIDKYNLEDRVGLGGQKPQVWFIPEQGNVEEVILERLEKIEQNTNKMFENLDKYGLDKLLE